MIKLSYLIFKTILRVRHFYHLYFAYKLRKGLVAYDKGGAELGPRGGGGGPWAVTAVPRRGSQAWKAPRAPSPRPPLGGGDPPHAEDSSAEPALPAVCPSSAAASGAARVRPLIGSDIPSTTPQRTVPGRAGSKLQWFRRLDRTLSGGHASHLVSVAPRQGE